MCTILEELLPAGQNEALVSQGIASYGELKQFVEDRPGPDRRYAIDSGKVQKELGWSPLYELESGLRTTVQWYLDNLDWCAEVQSGNYRRERLGLVPDGEE